MYHDEAEKDKEDQPGHSEPEVVAVLHPLQRVRIDLRNLK